MTYSDYISFDALLKNTLQTYLANITTIVFDPEDRHDDVPTGWVNLHKIDYNKPQRIFNPFPQPVRATYGIEIRLNLKGTHIQTLDDELLRVAEYLKGALIMLRINGTSINHKSYFHSTIFKGININSYNRVIEPLATGNQNFNDKLYQGVAVLNCTYRL